MLAGGVWLGDIAGAKGLLARLAVGSAAVMGHIFTVYLRFKGGKGVATSFGVAVGLWPYYTICAAVSLIVWVISVLIWRYISLASLAGAIVFPVVLILSISLVPDWRFSELWPLIIVAVGIPILVFIRHKENVMRLIAGKEGKVLQKGKSGRAESI